MWKFLVSQSRRLKFFYLENILHIGKKDYRTIQNDKIPVVFLVAGIYGSAHGLIPLKNFLESKGYPVYLPPKEKNKEPIPKLAKKLTKQILEAPQKKVQIIAHSMGGLTALTAMQNPKVAKKVAQVITLGSPLNGCILGSLAFWEHKRNRRYLKFLSKDTKKLTAKPSINRKVRSLFAKYDGIVFPKKASILNNAKENFEVNVNSHVDLILSPKAWKEIVKRLVK